MNLVSFTFLLPVAPSALCFSMLIRQGTDPIGVEYMHQPNLPLRVAQMSITNLVAPLYSDSVISILSLIFGIGMVTVNVSTQNQAPIMRCSSDQKDDALNFLRLRPYTPRKTLIAKQNLVSLAADLTIFRMHTRHQRACS